MERLYFDFMAGIINEAIEANFMAEVMLSVKPIYKNFTDKIS